MKKVLTRHIATLTLAFTTAVLAFATPSVANAEANADSLYAQAVKRKTKGPITDMLSKMSEEEFNKLPQVRTYLLARLTSGMEEEYAKILKTAFGGQRYYELHQFKKIEDKQRREDAYNAVNLFQSVYNYFKIRRERQMYEERHEREKLSEVEKALLGKARNPEEFERAYCRFRDDYEKVLSEIWAFGREERVAE